MSGDDLGDYGGAPPEAYWHDEPLDAIAEDVVARMTAPSTIDLATCELPEPESADVFLARCSVEMVAPHLHALQTETNTKSRLAIAKAAALAAKDSGSAVARAMAEECERIADMTPLSTITAASLFGQTVPERRWVVPEMIPSDTVTLFFGDGGVGKSTVALQLCVAGCSKVQWLGRDVAHGPVVYVSAEDDKDELHRRLVMVCKSLGVPLSSLTDLHIVCLVGRDAVMAAPDGKVIRPTSVFRAVEDLVRRVKPRLVAVDTLADVFAGDEIKRAEARQCIGIFRSLAIDHQTAVVLLAHPSLTGINTGTGTSGSTGWSNSARSRLFFETLKAEDGKTIVDPDARVLRVMKANYGPTGTEIRMRWCDGVYVLDEPGSAVREAGDARAENTFLMLLRQFNEQGRDVSPNKGPTYAPAMFSKEADARGMKSKPLEGAMSRLLKDGRVQIEKFGSPSKQRSRLVAAQERSFSDDF